MAKGKSKLGHLTAHGRKSSPASSTPSPSAHDDNCDLETLAERLGMKSGTLRRTLAKMTDAGYVTVEGSAEYV